MDITPVPPSPRGPVASATPMETDDTESAMGGSSGELDQRIQQTRLLYSSILEQAQGVDQAPLGALEATPIVWETTGGYMTITFGTQSVAPYVEGDYLERDGYVRGLAKLTSDDEDATKDGRWRLDGRYRKHSQSQENAMSLTWDRALTRLDGRWFRGDGAGEWKCVASPLVNDFRGLAATQTAPPPFFSGLINMKQNLTNVCYQNSFLQTLFATQAFRRLVLSHSTPDDLSDDVLRAVRDLFARLVASQRPQLDSHALQRCLPPTFQAGRQQDTSDFAHFMMDALAHQLPPPHGISDVFGGTQATLLTCKTCGKTSVNREYFWEMLLNMIDLRYTPITGIVAVSGASPDIALPSGFERLNNDLNKDRQSGAPYVYLCVRRSPEGSHSELPITDLMVKAVPLTEPKPVVDGYERVELDLNLGGAAPAGQTKKQVYLFYSRDPSGSPITDLQIVYGNEPVPDGFKAIRVDLNQGDGTKVFLCYRCDMPITDLRLVTTGIPGYKMIDHVLSRSSSSDTNENTYLAYKVGGSEACVTDLQLVKVSAVPQLEAEGWQSLGSPEQEVESTESQILMARRGHGNPIVAIDVFRAPRQVPRYNDYEVIDLYGQSGKGSVTSSGLALRGDWMGGDDVDRSRKSVRIHSISDPVAEALVVKGGFDDKGEISAVAIAAAPLWSQNPAKEDNVAQTGSTLLARRVLRVTGYWRSPKTKQAQLFDVELRPSVTEGSEVVSYLLDGTIGDGKGRAVSVRGTQTTRQVRVKWPISELLVIRGDERVPEGVEVVRETCSGKTGNLLAQTQSPYSLYLAVKREPEPADGYISEVCVIYGEIDAVPEGYTCIETTPSGFSANANDGTSGVPIFLCYRRTSSPFASADSNKCLMDVALMWTSGTSADSVPAGFTKIQHTPLGMEANLNQGTNGVAIHVCVAKGDPREIAMPLEDPLNGEYEITSTVAPGATSATPTQPIFGRFLRLAVMERVGSDAVGGDEEGKDAIEDEGARIVEGKFGTVFHGYFPGMLRGTLYTSKQRKARVLTGVWMSDETNASSMVDFVPPSYPFEWTINDRGNEVNGWWCGADDASSSASGTTAATSSSSVSPKGPGSNDAKAQRPWKLMKDEYVRIAFKKDYGTEWKDGRLISSERVWRHDIESMMSRFVAARTLGGDNLLSCEQCERKTESRTHTVVVAPPKHLILTLKRMYYDWVQQKTRKCLHDVTFSPLLTLPALSDEDEAVIYAADGTSAKLLHRQRQYGLYGVLVHSGLTANSGHYYSYCRESDDRTKQLHLEDAPLAPWVKFNDTKVERATWAEINQAVANSVSDTVYLLLYKRLSYSASGSSVQSVEKSIAIADAAKADVVGSDDEDEAMLLAKAMALSMASAATTKPNDQTLQLDSEYDASAITINRDVLHEVEQANAQYLMDTMKLVTSDVHTDDLHRLVALQRGLTEDMTQLLE
ncbi:hypothetical protein PINS_up002125 [Pythium insidiosum]|nr:hypothetical protein PINS_up002125 [Pythium insidiosum]